jgi:GxxExxY protein
MERVPDDLHAELTGEIIGAFYRVYNTLGYGFLESVYQNALMMTLRKRGHQVGIGSPWMFISRERWSATTSPT